MHLVRYFLPLHIFLLELLYGFTWSMGCQKWCNPFIATRIQDPTVTILAEWRTEDTAKEGYCKISIFNRRMFLSVTSDPSNYSKCSCGGFFEVVSSDCYLPNTRRSLVSCKQRVNSLLPLVPSLAGERVCQNSCWGKQGWENAFGKGGLPAEDPAQP